MNNVEVDGGFAFRVQLRDSLFALNLLFWVAVFVLAYMFVIFERPDHDGHLRHFGNAVWLTLITMTTVGYGDIYPETTYGRMVAAVAAFFAVVFMGLIVSAVTERLSLRRDEEKVLEFVADLRSRRDRKAAAATLIQTAFRAADDAKRVPGVPGRRIVTHPGFSAAVLEYSSLRSAGADGISTDVALTTTENNVAINRVLEEVTSIKETIQEMQRRAASTSPVGGRVTTQSTRF